MRFIKYGVSQDLMICIRSQWQMWGPSSRGWALWTCHWFSI